MFGKQFYPTPPELANKMVEPYLSTYGVNGMVLDPSAGSGALLDAVYNGIRDKMQAANEEREKRILALKDTNPREYDRLRRYSHYYRSQDWERYRSNLHAVEIDPDLQHIVRGKGYKVVGSDFLEFNTPYSFNLIVMNPPFDSGAKHLLKAWEILRDGDIVCLLNAETIRNQCTKDREVLAAIIEKHGEVEFVGQPFKSADRPTDVEVAMVRLKKSATAKIGLFDDPKFSKTDFSGDLDLDELPKNQLAKRDVIGNLVRQYNETADYYIQYRRACRRMYAMRNNFDFEGSDRTINDPGVGTNSVAGDEKEYNDFLQKLTSAAWKTVFRLTKFEKRMTERVKKEFEKNREQMLVMEFTEENIYNVLETLLSAADQIAKQCVLDVYDELTRYHKDNREIVEGWKSNNAYRVKRKFISPRGVRVGWDNRFDVDYRLKDGILGDIDKAMCFIAGCRIESIDTIYDTVKEKAKEIGGIPSGSVDTTCESAFFNVRFYKKGTLHLTFKDDKIWSRFNRFVAKERGWLQDYEGEKGAVVNFSESLEKVF